VVLLVGTGILAALAILGGTAFVALDRMEVRLSAERLLLARSVAEHLDTVVQADMEVLQGVSASRIVSAGDRQVVADRSTLREIYLRARLVDHVVLIAADGTTLLREPPARTEPVPPPDPRDVRAAITSGRPMVSSLSASGSAHRLYLLIPIRDWRGDVALLAAGEINPESSRFSSILDAFQLTPAGSIDVIDVSGVTLASAAGAGGGTTQRRLPPPSGTARDPCASAGAQTNRRCWRWPRRTPLAGAS
jgi:hypothetical protein